jgi:hypothetical protein
MPIIALTSHAMKGERERLFSKPVQPNALFDAIERALSMATPLQT